MLPYIPIVSVLNSEISVARGSWPGSRKTFILYIMCRCHSYVLQHILFLIAIQYLGGEHWVNYDKETENSIRKLECKLVMKQSSSLFLGFGEAHHTAAAAI